MVECFFLISFTVSFNQSMSSRILSTFEIRNFAIIYYLSLTTF